MPKYYQITITVFPPASDEFAANIFALRNKHCVN